MTIYSKDIGALFDIIGKRLLKETWLTRKSTLGGRGLTYIFYIIIGKRLLKETWLTRKATLGGRGLTYIYYTV